DNLRVGILALGIRVLRPERFHRPVGGDRDLPSLTLALSEVVVAGADLDRGAPGPSLVVAVCDVELHVAETRARVAEHCPKDMNSAEPTSRRRNAVGQRRGSGRHPKAG